MYFNHQPIHVCGAFLHPFFKAKVAPVYLALRTISPVDHVDPEYYGTHPPWDLDVLPSTYACTKYACLYFITEKSVCPATITIFAVPVQTVYVSVKNELGLWETGFLAIADIQVYTLRP